MDVLPSEEEKLLRKSAGEYFETECPPSLVRAMEADPLGYPPALWRQTAELGWLGLALPIEYGGQGLPLGHLGIFFEEAGRSLAPLPLLSDLVPALAIAAHGSDHQKAELLPDVVGGSLILSWALLERDARLQPGSVSTRAERDGTDWLISGAKSFVENFSASRRCLITCRTAPASVTNEGLSVFLVDTSAHGISEIPLVTMAGEKQSTVSFEQVRVSAGDLLGEVDEGWRIAGPMLEQATALLCAQLLGAARKQFEFATDYAKERVAFGRPIGAFQAIAHACADMLIWLDGGELLTREALWRIDRGLPAAVQVAQAKAFCADKCMAIGRISNMIHGGIAFMREVDLNLWYRRVAAMTMKLGSSYEHRALIAAELLDRPGRVRVATEMYDKPRIRALQTSPSIVVGATPG